MLKFPRARTIRKRPRIFKYIKPFSVKCGIHEMYCMECLENFAAQAEYERPGHTWAVENGKVIYLEDVVVEHHLGRELKDNETVIHKNGDILDNRFENLEVIRINEQEMN